jgi:AraC-like DNA-binding protein
MRSLPQWLASNALPFLVALGVFLVLALWRAIPRFGPLQPNPAPDRRSLVEHLSAMGRFYSMQRQLPRLIQIVRHDDLELLGSRAPETRGQDGAARLKSAARVTGLRPRELLQAFTATVTTPHEFITAVRVLAAFRQQLSPHAKATEPQRSRGRLPPAAVGKDRRRDHKTRAEFDRAFSQGRAEAEEKA